MRALNRLFWMGIICLFTAWNGFADVATLFVPKAAKPPELDGKINDAEWANGAKSGPFMLLAGSTNAVTERTEAFVMRDDGNLYVAFRCHESQVDRIKATVKKRNGNVWEDNDVEFFISTGPEPDAYRQFIVNSSGVQYDDRGGKDGDWQAITAAGSNLWSVEMAIPFTYLGIKPEEGLIFRANFCRGQKPKGENSAWPPILSGAFNDLRNSARIVFGASYKATALHEIEGVLKKTENLVVTPALAGEKAAILDEANKLAEEIKVKSVATAGEFNELSKRIALLEDRRVALEAKTVQERFGGAAVSNNLYVTSGPARSGYELPEVWATRRILGKDFWFDIIHWPSLWKKAGLENEPFIKDSLMRFDPYVGSNDFESIFFDPSSEVCKILKNTDRPFCLAGQDYAFPSGIAPSLCRRFLAEYGHKFAGFMADECFGNYGPLYWQKAGLSLPCTRHEAFLGFMSAYFNPVMEVWGNRPPFRSWSLTNPEFRPWTSCGAAVFLDHWMLEMGAPFTGEEIYKYRPMQFAFSRGAARQYGKPWRAYIQRFWGGVGGISTTAYAFGSRSFLSPECRFYGAYPPGGWTPGFDTGPYGGEPLSLQRRTLYAVYMAGANIIRDEQDNNWSSSQGIPVSSLYIAYYDDRDIEKIDPLVKVLRDRPDGLSPVGATRKELYDKIVKRQERGVPYTPVGLVFDRYHGFATAYAPERVLGILPYTEGDYMMSALHEALFPRGKGDVDYSESGGDYGFPALMTGPYGDIFDALTNNAQLEILKAYRALLLAGDVELDKLFAERLMQYVEAGGTLVLNARQVKDGTLSAAFLGCKISKERGEGRIAFGLPDKTVITERKPFKYQRLEPVSARPLIVRADGDGQQDVLATVNNYGKGVVVLTAPDYMYEAGSKTRMLDMFGYLMGHLRDELLPIKWQGSVEVLVNRNSKGWVVTLINNAGVIKKPGQQETFDDTKKAEVWLRLNAQAGGLKVKKVAEWTEDKQFDYRKTPDGAELKIIVPPGDIRILEFNVN